MVSKILKTGLKKAAKGMTKADKKGAQLGSKVNMDKSKAYSAMNKIRSRAKVKSEDDPRNYPRDPSNPFGKRDEMEKTGIKPRKKQTTKKAKGGMVGKPKGCGAATRGYGKAMKGKK